MRLDRRMIALIALGLIVLGYFAYMVVGAFTDPVSIPSVPGPEPRRKVDIPSAEFAGETAVRQIAQTWDEAALVATLDPTVHGQLWFSELKGNLPVYRRELGSVAAIVGNATHQPRGTSDYYDYRGEAECLLGKVSVRVLLLDSPTGFRVMGIEFTLKPKEPTEPGQVPESGSGENRTPASDGPKKNESI